MDAADGQLVAGIVEWLYGEILLDVGFAPAGHLAVSGRADGWDIVADGMLSRTAEKSVRYEGEMVVPESLDAVRLHLPF